MENSSRLDKEEVFHDQWASSIDPAKLPVDIYWSAPTSPERLWMKTQFPPLQGLRVLDLGCGAGEGACWFALQGARVVASDLSQEFCDLAQAVARHHGVEIEAVRANSIHLDLEPESFDIIYAANVLHHVENHQETIEGCKRLLKKGGLFVSMDPLAHNPVIDVYRRMATKVRTVDEEPLRMQILELFRRNFSQVKYECFWFSTLWIFLYMFVIERVHPSADRYWIRVIEKADRYAWLYRPLAAFDRMLLGTFPWLKRFCWNLAVVAVK